MADYPLDIPGFEEDPLWLQAPLIGTPRLMQGDERCARGEELLDRIVTDDDGDELVATIKPRSFGLDLPAIVIDDVAYEPTRALPLPDMIAAIFPIVLALTSGIWGAVMGGAAILMNFPILRSDRPYWQRIAMVFGTFILAILGTQVLLGIVNGTV